MFNFVLQAQSPAHPAGSLLAVSLLLFFKYTEALAGDRQADVTVNEQGGAYHIIASATVDAPAEYVRYVLSDFTHIYRLNPSIIESEVLYVKDDSTHVRTRVLGCTGYFCQDIEQVEKVRVLASGELVSIIMPEKSDFESGYTVWRIERSGNRSRIYYESKKVPDFYVPPVVGKFMAKKSIRNEVATTIKNIERIAGVVAERDWQLDYVITAPSDSIYTPCNLAVK